jgi:hypothetical protein
MIEAKYDGMLYSKEHTVMHDLQDHRSESTKTVYVQNGAVYPPKKMYRIYMEIAPFGELDQVMRLYTAKNSSRPENPESFGFQNLRSGGC